MGHGPEQPFDIDRSRPPHNRWQQGDGRTAVCAGDDAEGSLRPGLGQLPTAGAGGRRQSAAAVSPTVAWARRQLAASSASSPFGAAATRRLSSMWRTPTDRHSTQTKFGRPGAKRAVTGLSSRPARPDRSLTPSVDSRHRRGGFQRPSLSPPQASRAPPEGSPYSGAEAENDRSSFSVSSRSRSSAIRSHVSAIERSWSR